MDSIVSVMKKGTLSVLLRNLQYFARYDKQSYGIYISGYRLSGPGPSQTSRHA